MFIKNNHVYRLITEFFFDKHCLSIDKHSLSLDKLCLSVDKQCLSKITMYIYRLITELFFINTVYHTPKDATGRMVVPTSYLDAGVGIRDSKPDDPCSDKTISLFN